MKALLLGVAMAVVASSANAAVTFNLDSPSGLLGNTQGYNNGGLSITASGFTGSGGSPTALFGKAAGSDENGLGLHDDPTSDNEISGTNFIQIDVSKASASSYQFVMGSSTSPDAWDVFGSNTAGVLGTSLLTGTNESLHTIVGGYGFYDFEATDGNVLLSTFSAAVPEPSTWIMMILGFGGIGVMMRRARRPAVT
jgi:hypothetical protein